MEKRIAEKVRFDLELQRILRDQNLEEMVQALKWLQEYKTANENFKEINDARVLELILWTLDVLAGSVGFFVFLCLGVITKLVTLKDSQRKKWLEKHHWDIVPPEKIKELINEKYEFLGEMEQVIEYRSELISLYKEVLLKDGYPLMTVVEPVSIDRGLASEFDEYLEIYRDLPVWEFHYQDFKKQEQLSKVKNLHKGLFK